LRPLPPDPRHEPGEFAAEVTVPWYTPVYEDRWGWYGAGMPMNLWTGNAGQWTNNIWFEVQP